jgi:hypothetical protein
MSKVDRRIYKFGEFRIEAAKRMAASQRRYRRPDAKSL